MSVSQRDAEVLRDLGRGVVVVKARAKYDRRFKMLVVQDGDQILREFPLGSPRDRDNLDRALWFAQGYQMGKAVWDDAPAMTKEETP